MVEDERVIEAMARAIQLTPTSNVFFVGTEVSFEHCVVAAQNALAAYRLTTADDGK